MFRFFMVVICGLPLLAQFQISADQVFRIGDRYTTVRANALNWEPGPGGNNQLWDFSTLVPQSETRVTQEVLNPTNTPYFADFPAANRVVKVLGSQPVYGYWQVTESGMDFLGSRTTTGSLTFSDPQTLMVFPFGVGDQYSDIFSGTLADNGTVIQRTGTQFTEADGWGRLLIPSGQYDNVLRVVQTESIVDQAGEFEIQTNHEQFVWWIASRRQPLMIFDRTTTILNGNSIVQSNVTFLETNTQNQDPPQTSWLPHITDFNGGFETNLRFWNGSSQAQTLILEGFSAAGLLVERKETVLAAQADYQTPAENLFNGVPYSHLKITADVHVHVTAAYRAKQNGASAHLPQQKPQTQFSLYSGEWDWVFDGMALVNTSDQPAQIVAQQWDVDGNLLASQVVATNLAPLAKTSLVFDSVFAAQPGSSLTLTCTQPCAAIFLRGTRFGAAQGLLYANPPLSEMNQSVQWVPHLAQANGGFTSTLLFQNPSASEKSVTLKPYLSDGTGLAEISLVVPAASNMTLLPQDVFGNRPISHFSVSTTSVQVTVAFKSAQGEGASAHVPQTEQASTQFGIYPGEPDRVWDGVALVNIGTAQTKVTASVLDTNGQVLETVTLTEHLATYAKHLAVLGSLFQNSAGNRIRLNSDQPLVVVFLRGTIGSGASYLFANPALVP
ncbi:MAG: hypothetical protein H6510_09355 [Acidobacteria bacterium]|nr:hypothetical protein [Acidobacteriota bacterium]MCB9398011.1 hypothetical protein [Acidobacteriota bacterium]